MMVIINRWWQRPLARACHPTLSWPAQPVVFNPQPTKKAHTHILSRPTKPGSLYAQPAVPEPKPAEKPAARKHNKPAAQPAARQAAQPAAEPIAQPATKPANKPKKPRRKSPTPSLGSQDELLDYGDGDQDMPQAPMGDSEEPSGSPSSSSSGKAAPAESHLNQNPLPPSSEPRSVSPLNTSSIQPMMIGPAGKITSLQHGLTVWSMTSSLMILNLIM